LQLLEQLGASRFRRGELLLERGHTIVAGFLDEGRGGDGNDLSRGTSDLGEPRSGGGEHPLALSDVIGPSVFPGQPSGIHPLMVG